MDFNFVNLYSVGPPVEDLSQEETYYSQTVSMILQTQYSIWAVSTSSSPYSSDSAFAKWTNLRSADLHHLRGAPEGTSSQWLLKYILFTVPYLHSKYSEENSPKSSSAPAAIRFCKSTPQYELSVNHVLAERRRREKLNERFVILRSLVPFVTKMDKASILGDTIEYVKQLKKKIQDLEKHNHQMEQQQHQQLPPSRSSADPPQRTSNSKEQRRQITSRRVGPALSDSDKRKMRVVEGRSDTARPKVVNTSSPPPLLLPLPVAVADEGASVEVSIIESDVLIELQCGYREGLLLDMMQMLRNLRIELSGVQSSLIDKIFVAELRAKMNNNVSGKKLSIMDVKRAMRQIIPHD